MIPVAIWFWLLQLQHKHTRRRLVERALNRLGMPRRKAIALVRFIP